MYAVFNIVPSEKKEMQRSKLTSYQVNDNGLQSLYLLMTNKGNIISMDNYCLLNVYLMWWAINCIHTYLLDSLYLNACTEFEYVTCCNRPKNLYYTIFKNTLLWSMAFCQGINSDN